MSGLNELNLIKDVVGNISIDVGSANLNITATNAVISAVTVYGMTVLEWILFAVNLYVFSAVCTYGYKELKKERSTSMLSKRIRISATLGPGFGFLYSVMTLLIRNAPEFTLRNCSLMFKTRTTLTICVAYCNYATLWFRQRSFYVIPILRHLTTKTRRGLSLFSAYWNLAWFFIEIVFMFGIELMEERGVCINVFSTISEYDEIFLLLGLILHIFFAHISALVLLFSMLWKHTRQSVAIELTADARTNETMRSKEIETMKRILIISVLIFILDNVSAMQSLVGFSEHILTIANSCIVVLQQFIFANWKERLNPWHI